MGTDPKTGDLTLKRKAGAGKGTKAAMGGIMQHDEGPYAKLDWPSKKGQVAEKPSAQNEKKLKRQTFIKVMSDKKEPRRQKYDPTNTNEYF